MIRSLRIVTGLVLFAYVAVHLVNVGFGLVSIDMMDRVRRPLMAVWTNPAGQLVLLGSLVAHLVLALHSLYRRGTLRMSRTDAVQYIAGLAIPPLLIPHVTGTVAAAEVFGILPSYRSLIPYFWIYEPTEGLRQVLVLVVAWVHGCVGLFTWMRLQRWWDRLAPFCYPLAVAIPVVALLGFAEAGKEAIDPPEPAAVATPAPGEPVSNPVTREALDALSLMNRTMLGGYALALVLVLVARGVRRQRSRSTVRVTYADGPTFEQEAGLSLLELATVNGVAHANLCRGRGRCGTCRVRILAAEAELPPVSEIERRTLDRVGAPDGVRLACQLVPGAGTLRIERVLPPHVTPADLKAQGETAPEPLQPEPAAS